MVSTLQIQCCMCRKMKIDGRWQLSLPLDTPAVSHSYCPECYEKVVKDLKKQGVHVKAS